MIIHLFTFILLTAFSPAHDFKMSVCEITYEEEQKVFEVKFYLFQDDLKVAIFGNPIPPELEASSVSNYILKKTKLSLNEKAIALSFSEMKEREDQIQVVFRSEVISLSPNSKLKISNQLFLDKFKQQTNMVYLNMPGRSKITQIMNGAKTEVEFPL